MTTPAAPIDYTSDLHDLARLVARPHATTEVVERALAALGQVVPYDLAAAFRIEGDRARVFAVAGPLGGERVRRHELDLGAFPSIRRALETRRPVPLDAHDHAGDEGDPYDGILNLPHGHSCMVVPLYAGDRTLGLITLDRTTCGVYPPGVVDIAGVYGQLISLALFFADQAALLDRYRHQLKAENRLLREESSDGDDAVHKLESSVAPAMRELTHMARQVAASDLPVLVLGETGAGKEVVARALHAWSPRVDGPYVKLNCSAIPEGLVESELFGHVKGAFSGADRARDGRFLVANGGTLLLDEIGDMPLSAQSKLLRVLQEGTFEPVGADRTVKVDVRVVAATHVDLQQAVADGRFREDLYYRLAVFPLRLPPLRARTEDAVAIASSFLDREHRRSRRGPWTLSESAEAAVRAWRWPGNVRELVNALERATILQPAGVIEIAHLGLGAGLRGPAAPPWAPVGASNATLERVPADVVPTWQDNERRYFKALLARTGGKLYGADGAAALAGLKPTTLRSRLVKLGLR